MQGLSPGDRIENKPPAIWWVEDEREEMAKSSCRMCLNLGVYRACLLLVGPGFKNWQPAVCLLRQNKADDTQSLYTYGVRDKAISGSPQPVPVAHFVHMLL